jgi:hypothetical protein
MVGINVNRRYLLDLRKQIREAQAANKELDTFFFKGADRLVREADLERLRSLTTRLKYQLDEAVSSEDSARWSLANWDGGIRIGTSLATWLGSVIMSPDWVEGAERLEKRRSNVPHCFGMIMVCVDKGGIPDDVSVVSISELSRKQNQMIPTVINKIRESGALLFSPDKFWQLIEELGRDIWEGKRRLPVFPESLKAKQVIIKSIVESQNKNSVIAVIPIIVRPKSNDKNMN